MKRVASLTLLGPILDAMVANGNPIGDVEFEDRGGTEEKKVLSARAPLARPSARIVWKWCHEIFRELWRVELRGCDWIGRISDACLLFNVELHIGVR